MRPVRYGGNVEKGGKGREKDDEIARQRKLFLRHSHKRQMINRYILLIVP